MNNYIEIGEIYREHGLKGLCKVYIYSQSDDALEIGQTYLLESVQGQTQKAVIETLSSSQKFFLIQFDCFHGADQVVPWRKAKIKVDQKLLKRSDNEVFEYEWIGLTLVDSTQKILGLIKRIERNPLPQFVVESHGREILIPWVEAWILSVDQNKKTLIMDLPEGLIDLD